MIYPYFFVQVQLTHTFLLQKQFTHTLLSQKRFTRFFGANTIYALRPESFCALKVAILKVQTFWASGWWSWGWWRWIWYHLFFCQSQVQVEVPRSRTGRVGEWKKQPSFYGRGWNSSEISSSLSSSQSSSSSSPSCLVGTARAFSSKAHWGRWRGTG